MPIVLAKRRGARNLVMAWHHLNRRERIIAYAIVGILAFGGLIGSWFGGFIELVLNGLVFVVALVITIGILMAAFSKLMR